MPAMPDSSVSHYETSPPWLIQGTFRIEADDQDDAERALDAIERTARRTYGSTTVHVHMSEEFHDGASR